MLTLITVFSILYPFENTTLPLKEKCKFYNFIKMTHYNKKLALTSMNDRPSPYNINSKVEKVYSMNKNSSSALNSRVHHPQGNDIENAKRRLLRSIQSNKSEMCPDCREQGVIICDNSEGTQICSSCGMVVESRILSDEAEWRNFSNDGSSKKNDRNRVGEMSDVWLENHVTSTTFIKSSKKLQHLNMLTQINKGDQILVSAFSTLKLICETFSLRSSVVERAKEITKELYDIEQLKTRSNTLNMLAVVYLACREAGHIKSIKELITFDRSFKEKDLGKTINKLKKALPNRAFVYNEDISHLIYSLSNRLQLSVDLIDDIEFIVKKASTLITTSHRLNSLCGGSIYLVVELNALDSEEKIKLPSLPQIASVCGVTSNTLKTTFKELLNAATYILPKSYLQEENTKLVTLKQKYLLDEKRKKK